MDIKAIVEKAPLDAVAAALILLPMTAAILIYFFRSAFLRNTVILITAWTLTLSAFLLFLIGAYEQADIRFTPSQIGNLSWDQVILVADYVLMALFVLIGIMRKSWVILVLALAQAIPLVIFETTTGHHIQAQGHAETIAIDWLSIGMVGIISIIGSIIAVYAIPYMKDHEEHHKIEKTKQPQFFFFIMLFLGAMNGLVLADNLLWLCFFWEVTTLCSFILIGHDGADEAKANAMKALWMNLLGGVGFVAAIILFGLYSDSLSVRDLIEQTANGDVKPLMLLPLALICFAGLTKAAQMPFQNWLLGAMVAPTPVSALLHSSTMVKAGVYIIVRFAPAFHGTTLSDMVAIIGGFTFLVAAMLAVGQDNAKRVLAYSTISNLGLIIGCAGLNAPLSLTAAVMLIIFHAISKGLLFMGTGVVEHKIWSRQIEDMQGLAAKMPLTTSLMVLGIFSMLLPPFGVLIAKWAAIEASANLMPALVLFVMGSTFTVVFWSKWMGRMLTTPPGSGGYRMEKLHSMYVGPLVILAVGAVMFSALLDLLLRVLVTPAVEQTYARLNIVFNGFDALGADALQIPWLVPMLFVFLFVSLVVPILWYRAKNQDIKPAYLCGEQMTLEDNSFITVADSKEPLAVSSYYLDAFVGEAKHLKWASIASSILIVAMIGVVFLWK